MFLYVIRHTFLGEKNVNTTRRYNICEQTKRKKYCTLIKSTIPCPLLTIVFTIVLARDSRTRKKLKCVHRATDEEEYCKTIYLIKPFFSFFKVLFQQHQFLFSIISSAFHPFKLNKKLKIYSNKQTKLSSDSAIH